MTDLLAAVGTFAGVFLFVMVMGFELIDILEHRHDK